MINIEKIEIDVANQGHITNCYLVFDESKEAVLIDPADKADKIISKIKRLDVVVKYILITHAHGDHIGALEEIQNYTNANIIIHKNDLDMLLGNVENYCDMLLVKQPHLTNDKIITIEDGYLFKLGDLEFEIIHTSGHSAGCICLYEKNSNVLFTGDTLFADCYGRCDLYSGDFENMVSSIKRLFARFNNTTIYPGHGKSVKIESSKKYVRMLMAMKGKNI